MKHILLLFIVFLPSLSIADEIDVSKLLSRDLSGQIEIVSGKEIRYCPDNTCDIFILEKESPLLPAYVYLHIIFESSYHPLMRKEFIDSAKEKDAVLESLGQFCQGDPENPQCIIKELGKQIGVKTCFGRYDEGQYCYACGESETICKKL